MYPGTVITWPQWEDNSTSWDQRRRRLPYRTLMEAGGAGGCLWWSYGLSGGLWHKTGAVMIDSLGRDCCRP